MSLLPSTVSPSTSLRTGSVEGCRARLTPLRLVAAVALAVALQSCGCGEKPKPDAGIEPDAGEVDAGQPREDAGQPVVDAGEPDAGPPPVLAVKRILPPRGSSAGGTTVTLVGSAFIRDFASGGTSAQRLTAITFGGNPVLDFQVIHDETIELRSPPGTAGQVSVVLKNPNGRVTCNNCFTYFDELALTSLTPKHGPLAGGTVVTLTGQGFTTDVEVLFGGLSSPKVTVASPQSLTAVAPPGAVADLVDVTVYNKNGVGTSRRGFRYDAPLAVTAVTPLAGPVAGGTVVQLTGSGFTGATAVTFGASAGTSLAVASDSSLTVTSPPTAAAGAVALTVATPNGSLTVKNGFTYVDAAGSLAVFGVFPHVLSPGDAVTVTGQGLDDASLTVSIGGQAATLLTHDFSTARVTVPARGGAPRRSDVVVTAASGTQTLAAGATWRLSVSAVTPNSGASAGGTVVALSGAALPVDAKVTLGAFDGTAVTVSSESALSFTTPAGSGGGALDVLVREAADPENVGVLKGGFTFDEPLSVGRVQPDRGAVAGGTLVTVLGAGFTQGTYVTVGPSRAKDIKLLDSHTITCRTPKGDVGTFDVKVQRLTETDTLPGGFSYFDPRSISGGLSGGPLVGTVNVTVLESTPGLYGAPVPLANVMLGNDSNTPFQGLTDARGQITFSDPSLVKAQTVTAFKENYQVTTVTNVNAENLTVFMARTGGGEGSPGSPPPGVPPSVISGRVTGFKTPRPLGANELLEARVFVAQTSLFGGPPFGGLPNKTAEKWQVRVEGGEYLVYTNAGLHAVYAVLGIYNTGSKQFSPLTMGIARGVTTSADNPATGKDIVLDMLLDLTVPITIDSPPMFPGLFGPEPGINHVYAWLDLGSEGFIPNPDNWDTGTAQASLVTTGSANVNFPHFPQLDGSNFIFLNDSAGSQSYPISDYFRRQPGDLHGGVTIGPMLPAPNIIEPTSTFTGKISWTIDPGAVPDINDVQIIKPTLAGNVTVWEVVMPGTQTEVTLPPAAVTLLQTQEAGNQLLAVIYSSRSPKFSYNQWTYDVLSGVSWSSFTIAVSPGFTP